MPELVVTALLAPSRLTLKLLRAFMWSLVFSAALVAAAVYGCIALTHVLCRPRRGCCGRPRRTPPACLSDPTLGEHCFLTLRVSMRGRHRGFEDRRACVGPVRGWQTVEYKCGWAHGLGEEGCSSPGKRRFPSLRLCPPPEFRPASALCLRWTGQRAPHAVSARLPGELVCLRPRGQGPTGLGGGEARSTRAPKRQGQGLGRLGVQSI